MNTNYQDAFEGALNRVNMYSYLQSAIQEIVTSLMDYFEAQAVSIFLTVGNHLPYHIACFGSDGFIYNLQGIAYYKSGEGLTGNVFKTGKAVFSNNLTEVTKIGKYYILKSNPELAHNIMLLPLIYKGYIIGVVKVEDKIEHKDFTSEEFEDLQKKASQIARVVYERSNILPNIPFQNPNGQGYAIFPPASLVVAPVGNFYYVGGIQNIRIIENNGKLTPIILFILYYAHKHGIFPNLENCQKILEEYMKDIEYDVNLPSVGTTSISHKDIRLFQDLIQSGNKIHFKASYPNAKFENKGVIQKIDYKKFQVKVKVTEGHNIGSKQDIPFWSIGKPLTANSDTPRITPISEPILNIEDINDYLTSFRYNYEADKIMLDFFNVKNDFFKDVFWSFSPKINVLFGKNGFGKSYLLRILAGFSERIKDKPPYNKENKFFTLGKRDTGHLHYYVDDKTQNIIYDTNQAKKLAKHSDKLPILYIPSVRFLPPKDIPKVFTAEEPIHETLAKIFIEGAPLGEFSSDIFSEIGEFYLKQKDKHPFIQIVYQTFKTLTGKAIRINVNSDSLNKKNIYIQPEGIKEGIKDILIQKASSGVVSIWLLLGLIYQHLEMMNSRNPVKEVHNSSGIVVIDEIDAHLHPDWQRKIVQILRDSFRNVQFIMTSHSPLVAASCELGEIAMLEKDEEEGFNIHQFDEEFITKPLEEIYKKVLDNTVPHSLRYEKILKKYQNGRLEEIKAELDTLNQKEELSSDEKFRILQLSNEFESILKVKKTDLEEQKRF